jgi:hypothetical protein
MIGRLVVVVIDVPINLLATKACKGKNQAMGNTLCLPDVVITGGGGGGVAGVAGGGGAAVESGVHHPHDNRQLSSMNSLAGWPPVLPSQ